MVCLNGFATKFTQSHQDQIFSLLCNGRIPDFPIPVGIHGRRSNRLNSKVSTTIALSTGTTNKFKSIATNKGEFHFIGINVTGTHFVVTTTPLFAKNSTDSTSIKTWCAVFNHCDQLQPFNNGLKRSGFCAGSVVHAFSRTAFEVSRRTHEKQFSKLHPVSSTGSLPTHAKSQDPLPKRLIYQRSTLILSRLRTEDSTRFSEL